MIAPKEDGQFVADMEKVLDVYKRPYNEDNPVVCMDESTKQLIKETRMRIPMSKGRETKVDYEYSRCGVCNIFIANEPLKGKRLVKVTDRKTKIDWAEFIKHISDEMYPEANKITLIMDNYSTHTTGSLYQSYSPQEAKRLCDRFEFVYTPKHGSWLNMAEIELNVLFGQCLSRHIDDIEIMKKEIDAWQNNRNNQNSKINWQFTTKDARIKLRKLYPSIQM